MSKKNGKKAELQAQTMVAPDGRTIRYTVGSGNIFADLGLPDADELFFKCELMHRIAQIIGAQGWTQQEAASHLKITQARVSNIINGRATGFSTDMLLGLLNQLGCDVEVRVKKPKLRTGQTRVVMA
jgi:predicted XRE-type DNA-binding protein